MLAASKIPLRLAASAMRLQPLRHFCRTAVIRESVSAGDIREGDLLEIDGGLWRVMSRAFSRTAQGRAYIQTELRHLTEEVKKNTRLRSEDIVERAALSTPTKYQVLYVVGSQILAMHQTTFEQIEIPVSLLGNKAQFLQDGITIVIESHDGVPVLVHLPQRMTFEVTSLEDSTGTALTSHGFKCRVPKHVRVGDKIVVDTEDGRYVSKE